MRGRYIIRSERTSASDEHVHVLSCTADGRPDGENDDERQKDGFATEARNKITNERNDGGGSDSEGAPNPNEVRPIQVAHDCWEGS